MTWCYVPEMDCPSAQAVVDLIWASCWPNRDSTPAPLSNGRNPPDGALSQHSAPDTSPLPQFGMTSQLLTENQFAGRSTPSLPDTHASHSVRPDSARERTTNATSGRTLHASSTKSGHDGFGSKTSEVMSRLAQKPCCENYKPWVMRLQLAFSQRQKQARRMKGAVGSQWPTATATSQAQTAESPTPGQTGGTTLAGSAEQMWKTPDVPNGGRSASAEMSPTGMMPDGTKRQVGLENQAKMWATPATIMTREGWTKEQITQRQIEVKNRTNQNGKHHTGNGTGLSLAAQATIWPTPASRDHKGENSPDHLLNGTGRKHMDQLPNFVAHGFSHPDHPTQTHGATWQYRLGTLRQLWALTKSSHGRSIARRLFRNRHKRRLNPLFVEWLMGWPPGHALCDCSEMEWSHWLLRMRGALSVLPTAYAPWIWEPPMDDQNVQGDLFETLNTESEAAYG